MKNEDLMTREKNGPKEDLAFYFNNMGLAYFNLARPVPEDSMIHDEAITMFDQAILNYPSATYYYNRGNACMNLH